MEKKFDFTLICRKYRGKWLALSDEDKVITSGTNAKKVFEKAKQKGYEIPTLFKVPKELVSYVGLCR